jgi:hypothetical protein
VQQYASKKLLHNSFAAAQARQTMKEQYLLVKEYRNIWIDREEHPEYDGDAHVMNRAAARAP